MCDEPRLRFHHQRVAQERKRAAAKWCNIFSNVAKDKAKRQGLSYRLIADALDVSLGTVANWMTRPASMRLVDAYRLSELLDVYAFAQPE